MRWKYVYYFLIVTFLLMIFVSLISISVCMYLNEVRNQPVTIYSLGSPSNSLTNNVDENYNCSTSDGDQIIDNTKQEQITANNIDKKNIPNTVVNSVDSASTLRTNNANENDKSSTSHSYQSIDNTRKEPVTASSIDNIKIISRSAVDSVNSSVSTSMTNNTNRNYDRSTSDSSKSTNNTTIEPIIASNPGGNEKISKSIEQSTSTPDKSILWLDINNTDWILPIFFRNTSVSSLAWGYACMGTLIHPKALLTVRYCAQPIKKVEFAVGIFNHEKESDEFNVDYDKLYSPLNMTNDYRSYKLMKLSYLRNNERVYRRKPEYGLVVMIIDGSINSITPVDVSRTSLMTLNDVFDEKIKKECIHVTYVKNSYSNRFVEYKVPEKIMNHTAIAKSYKTTYEPYYANLSLKYNTSANVFGTVESLKLNTSDQSYELFGSPLACRLVGDDPDHFSFAGLLIETIYTGMYEYTNVQYELEWIKKKLNEITT